MELSSTNLAHHCFQYDPDPEYTFLRFLTETEDPEDPEDPENSREPLRDITNKDPIDM